MKYRAFALLFLSMASFSGSARMKDCNDERRGLASLGCAVKDGKILPRRCVNGDAIFVYQGKSGLRVFNAYANDESSEALNHRLSVHGSAFFGLVKAGFESSFDASEEDRKLDMTYSVKFHSRPGVMLLRNPYLSDPGLLEDCGDSYVSEVSFGANFELVATLRFYDETSFQKFDAKFDVSALFSAIAADGKMTSEMESLASNSDIFIDVIQIGGDIAKLREIDETDIAIQCRLKRSLRSCFALFKLYDDYLTTELPKQLQVPTNSKKENGELGMLEAMDLGTTEYYGLLKGVDNEL